MTDTGQKGILAYLAKQYLPSCFTFLEVGVWRGDTSSWMLQNFPEMTYIGVDNYIPCSTMKDLGPQHILARQAAERVMEVYPNAELIIQDSQTASKNYKNKSIDFIFIDGEHTYKQVGLDLESWYPKTKRIISGHDYRYFPGVTQAVNEFAEKNKLAVAYHCGSGDVWWIVL
jgi:hypothetical protein